MKNLLINMLKLSNKKRKKRYIEKKTQNKKIVLKNELKNIDIERFSHVEKNFFDFQIRLFVCFFRRYFYSIKKINFLIS